MNLIIDVGNTNVKAAVYEDDTLVSVTVFKKKKILKKSKKILSKYTIQKGIISSVAEISEKKKEKLNKMLPFLSLSIDTKVPFTNLYTSPKTLGIDRIALITSAVKKHPKKNVLVIDAGTCITFDFINKKGAYLGGAIAPGIEMRYKSMATFTAKLPLLEKEIPVSFIGNSTKTCMHSGVVNGICTEIDGVISQYKEKFKDLTVVLTGGDTKFLSKQLKSSIFANQNFLLDGLNEILIYNTNE